MVDNHAANEHGLCVVEEFDPLRWRRLARHERLREHHKAAMACKDGETRKLQQAAHKHVQAICPCASVFARGSVAGITRIVL